MPPFYSSVIMWYSCKVLKWCCIESMCIASDSGGLHYSCFLISFSFCNEGVGKNWVVPYKLQANKWVKTLIIFHFQWTVDEQSTYMNVWPFDYGNKGLWLVLIKFFPDVAVSCGTSDSVSLCVGGSWLGIRVPWSCFLSSQHLMYIYYLSESVGGWTLNNST